MATKLHIEFDVDLKSPWEEQFADPYSEQSHRVRQRMKWALENKFTFGTISEIIISPKDSEV